MRKIWYVCMTVGFLWLLLIQLRYTLGSDARAVMKVQQRDFTWEERCYMQDEVYQRVLATARTANDIAPNVIWPALLLLIGGCGVVHNNRKSAGTHSPVDAAAV